MCIQNVFAQNDEHPKDFNSGVQTNVMLRLVRLPTCGECPKYEIQFFADGAVTYYGTSGVVASGFWRDVLPHAHFAVRDR